ncbi:hypothetical protein IGJ83_000371 [Enterococcus pernyi]|uniref:DUF7006 family protein n=1 Tax=Enterococcus mundtii TaxID=53346 RepID=UPI00045253A0|nr:hypothetical protein [Enterococcus mundtii]EYT94386.1 hypothetical protein AK89_13985 [Enterococcus mundtii CRL35]
MNIPLTTDEYRYQFQKRMPQDKRENEELNTYLEQQFEQLDQLTSTVSPDNFWENLPKILGVDAKLTLMSELISYDYNKLPINEILRIVETDYRTYFKELCGNEQSTKNKYSMIFNVV